MTGKLLVCGMLAGLVAALLSFGFLKVAGEPSVERAIAFEKAMDEVKAKAKADEAAAKGLPAPVDEKEPELVSRPVQAGIGLLTGVVVYGTAVGGLFALVFALAYGRIGDLSPRATAALLALLGFVSVYLGARAEMSGESAFGGAAGHDRHAYELGSLHAPDLTRGDDRSRVCAARLQARLGEWNATPAGAPCCLWSALRWRFPTSMKSVPASRFRIASLGAGNLLVNFLARGVLAERVIGEERPAFRQVLA